ncbi:MAG: Mth938-like domain-containing protein [Candidatus Bipolaricaulaceae bacterium]
MKLSGYRFGRIEVDGIPYAEDIWVCAGRIGRWWRKEGHRVHPEDLGEVLALSPEAVVIGTGFSGLVQVLPEVEALLSSRGIELFIRRTKEAVELYNALSQEKRVAALLHLTC